MEKLARFPADFENMSEIPRMVGWRRRVSEENLCGKASSLSRTRPAFTQSRPCMREYPL